MWKDEACGTYGTYRSFATRISQLKFVILQEKLLRVLKCYNCSPAVSLANCVMRLCLLKVHLQTFLSIPVTQKCQILSCDAVVANERYELRNAYQFN
jgi:hypothetical protein